MEEKEFIEKAKKLDLGIKFDEDLKIEIPVYYGEDDGNVIFDEESMREEFDIKMRDLREILE